MVPLAFRNEDAESGIGAAARVSPGARPQDSADRGLLPRPAPARYPGDSPRRPFAPRRAPRTCGRKYRKPFKQSPHNQTTNHRSHPSPVASSRPPPAPRAALTPPCGPRGAGGGDPGSSAGAGPPPHVCRPARHSLPEPAALTLKDILHMSAATPARPARFRRGAPAPGRPPLPAGFRSGEASRAARSSLRGGHAGKAGSGPPGAGRARGRRRGRRGRWGEGRLRGADAPARARPAPSPHTLYSAGTARTLHAHTNTPHCSHIHIRSLTHTGYTPHCAHSSRSTHKRSTLPSTHPRFLVHTFHAHPHSCYTYTHTDLHVILPHSHPRIHTTHLPPSHTSHIFQKSMVCIRGLPTFITADIDDVDETGEKNSPILPPPFQIVFIFISVVLGFLFFLFLFFSNNVFFVLFSSWERAGKQAF